MLSVGLFARLEAKPGKEDALALTAPPVIEPLDVLGAKLPEGVAAS